MLGSRSRTHYIFVGGKGGVGKTTCAAGLAIARAEGGRAVFLVSADPAHSLGDALGASLGPMPKPIHGIKGRLDAAELDADRALERWLARRERPLREILLRGTYLDDTDVARLLRMSVPGVDELMGLLEIERLRSRRAYDDVIVDLAPTGHALRLLQTPDVQQRLARVLDELGAKHRYVTARLGGSHVSDEPDAVTEELATAGARWAALLSDATMTTFYWVTLPELLSVEETRDAAAVLRRQGVSLQTIVVNRLGPAPPARHTRCAACADRADAEAAALEAVRSLDLDAELRILPDLGDEPRGPDALRRLGRRLVSKRARPAPVSKRGFRATAKGSGPTHVPVAQASRPARRTLATAPRVPSPSAEERLRVRARARFPLLFPRTVRLVVFAGKGGVGKTTCAAATAVTISAGEPQRPLLVLSVDPAHSLGDAFGVPVGDRGRDVRAGRGCVRLRELDAVAAFRARQNRYQRAIEGMVSGGESAGIDAPYDRDLARQIVELAPPGVDEVFAIISLIDALGLERRPVERQAGEAGSTRRRRSYDLVILDTAPTGHTLRLLELSVRAQDWARVVLSIFLKYRHITGLGAAAEDLLAVSRELTALNTLLRDERRTRFIVVTRPAVLPRRETRRLATRLTEMGMPLSAIVVNSLTEGTCARCRRVAVREDDEVKRIGRFCQRQPRRCLVLTAPATAPPPRGVAQLLDWGQRWRPVE